MINVQRAIMHEVDSMQELNGHCQQTVENSNKRKGMSKIKNTVTEVRLSVDLFIAWIQLKRKL